MVKLIETVRALHETVKELLAEQRRTNELLERQVAQAVPR